MKNIDLNKRTLDFAASVISFFGTLPRNEVAGVLGRQMVKSSTSIGANFRESGRAESRRDFVHKIALAEKECAETEYWLELARVLGIGDADRLQELTRECDELLAILVSIGRKTKNLPQPQVRPRTSPL